MRRYRLFGLTLATEFAFAGRLERASGPADLTFSCSGSPPFAVRLAEPIYESPFRDDSGDSLARLYRQGEAEILRFGDALDFYLGEDAIHCHLRDGAARHLVEILLLGAVMAYWLERMGVCALHASAVVVGGRAVAFLASHRGGKSGLAAAMLAAGDPLLSDDLLPLAERQGRLVALAGYPEMRLWSDQLEHLVTGWRRLEPVRPGLDKRRVPVGGGGFGTFHPAAAPPGAVYLPRRLPPEPLAAREVRLDPVTPREALIELVRHSFSPFIVEAVGLQPRRLDLLARLARRVPVRRLVYPPGPGALKRVRAALLDDLRAR